jgi:hypothetical protein
LLGQVHNLYKERFRAWFAIMAPTSLLGAAVLLLADQRVKAIFRTIPRGQAQYHLTDMVEANVLRFGTLFLSWLLGCFALAAIATVVAGPDGDDNEAVWRHDSYQRAREHLGPLVTTAVITFFAFLAGILAAGFVELAVARVIGRSHSSQFFYGTTLVGYVMVASIVGWLGTAIPLIVRGNAGVWQALKGSMKLSSGYEGALFLLVVESVAGSFLAWHVVLYGSRLFLPDHLRYSPLYGWVVNVVGVLASAAVEPPLFIGFSLLADPELRTASSLPDPEQAP